MFETKKMFCFYLAIFHAFPFRFKQRFLFMNEPKLAYCSGRESKEWKILTKMKFVFFANNNEIKRFYVIEVNYGQNLGISFCCILEFKTSFWTFFSSISNKKGFFVENMKQGYDSGFLNLSIILKKSPPFPHYLWNNKP